MTPPTAGIKHALQAAPDGLTRGELTAILVELHVDVQQAARALDRLLTDRVVLEREGHLYMSPSTHARRYQRGRRTGRVGRSKA